LSTPKLVILFVSQYPKKNQNKENQRRVWCRTQHKQNEPQQKVTLLPKHTKVDPANKPQTYNPSFSFMGDVG
jgi:uncharacterized protein affecting Mg2+/Co2+ transport